MENKSLKTRKLCFSAICLALALVLPFVTGQIQQIGNMLCPMHIPVLLCGFLCGPFRGAAVGFIAPFLRNVLFGMPPLFPQAFSMAFELAVYGIVTGVLYKKLPKKPASVYIALIAAMLAGRIVWGAVRAVISGAGGAAFTWKAFFAGAFTTAVPGIILQIVLIPLLVFALQKSKFLKSE